MCGPLALGQDVEVVTLPAPATALRLLTLPEILPEWLGLGNPLL